MIKNFTKLMLTAILLVAGMGGVNSVKAASKYLKLGTALTLEQALTASANSGTGFAIVYNDSKLLTDATSGSPTISCVDLGTATRGYMFKLTAKRATVSEVDYYRIECFNPDNTLVAAGDDAGAYGDNILSPVSWGDLWASTITSDERDGRDDFEFGAQWCFESDGAGGYYIRSRAVDSTKPYISGAGKMTDAAGKASFKFYSLIAKEYATLNFNSSGVATIDLSNYEVTSGLTYDPATGILTSTTTSEDLYFIFDNEDISSVTRIDVTRTTSGEENAITYSDIIDNLNIYDATSGNTLHTWYSSKYGVSDFQTYNPGRVNKIKWHINKAGSMKLTGITVTGRVVNGAAPGWTDVTTAMYNTGAVLNLNKDVACVYGKQDGFTADDYADISAYKKLKLTGVANTTVRVYVNSANAQYYTLDSNGNLIIDFETDDNYKDAEYLHLVNIRASAYNTTANISSVQLYHDDYVLSGSGRILASAQTILDNEALTSINATGINAATALTTANPNCLIKANTGMVTNTNNVIVGTTCNSLVLTDGNPFKAPSDFTATAAPTYNRTFTASTMTTVCLPFALTAEEAATLGTFYQLSTFDGVDLHFTSVAAPEANTPYLVIPTGTAITLSTGKSIAATPASLGASITYVEFIGTLAATAIPASDETNSYFAFNNGSLVKITSQAATLPAFRGYFKVTTSAINSGSNARRLGVSFDNEATGISDATRLKDKGQMKNDIFDLQGRRVKTFKKGLYIVNGKKVIK